MASVPVEYDPVLSSTSSPILMFVNSGSGGGLALDLIDYLSNVPSILIVKLPEEAKIWQNSNREFLFQPNLCVVAAGGDGTVNWVMQMLNSFYEDSPESRPPMAVFPFGTGNDMSRSLGWGSGMCRCDLPKIHQTLQKIASATHREDVDMWNITITNKRTKSIRSQPMINYFSIGVDAAICVTFSKLRDKLRPLLFNSLISKSLYVPAGIYRMCGIPSLCDYSKIETHHTLPRRIFNPNRSDSADLMPISVSPSDEPAELELLRPSKDFDTIVFQAIPSIYGGADLLSNTYVARAMNDGVLETVLVSGALRLALNHIGINLAKYFGQTDHVKIETIQPCFYQIDGEGFELNDPVIFEMTHVGSYPMIFAPQ